MQRDYVAKTRLSLQRMIEEYKALLEQFNIIFFKQIVQFVKQNTKIEEYKALLEQYNV